MLPNLKFLFPIDERLFFQLTGSVFASWLLDRWFLRIERE